MGRRSSRLKGSLVEFDRRPIDPYPLAGFALDWSDELTLLHELDADSMELNGYSIIRNVDVRRWRPRGSDTFLGRALKLKGVRPVLPARLPLANWREVFETVGGLFPLVTLHREKESQKTCFVGRVRSTTDKVVTLKNIDPEARWAEVKRYRFRDLTKVDFGSGYEEALALVAADRKRRR